MAFYHNISFCESNFKTSGRLEGDNVRTNKNPHLCSGGKVCTFTDFAHSATVLTILGSFILFLSGIMPESLHFFPSG